MRRNSVTIIKYVVFAAMFLTLGPMLVKLLFGRSHDSQTLKRDSGLPQSPDERNVGHVDIDLKRNAKHLAEEDKFVPHQVRIK